MAMGGWDQAASIDDVLERMAAIDAALPQSDGVAYFNRMYWQVTRLVDEAVDASAFEAGEFLARLDVHFANLYFAAYAADLAGTRVSPAWAPLFEARARDHTHPIQFALAGMNAHISHDLPHAVVDTCVELSRAPLDDSPEHSDFTRTNDVLAEAQDQIKGWFTSGIIATVDQLGGKVDDGFATFGIHVARAAAWQTSEMLWELSGNERLDRLFRDGLSQVGRADQPRHPPLRLVQPATRKPRATAAGTAEPATYMWDLPGKITTRPSGMASAVRRNRSSE